MAKSKTIKAVLRGCGVITVASMVVLTATGYFYQGISESRDLKRFPPPGQLYEVNGHKMHLYCQGSGSPTVVVEPGQWGNAWQWQHVILEIAETTRVCGYDRPGFGYSEYAKVKSMRERAAILKALLDTAGISDDLVLIGHSLGGFYVRNYFKHYPESVVGMVLVESSHERQPPGKIDVTYKIYQYIALFGIARMLGLIEDEIARSPMPEETKPRQIALYSQSHTPSAMVDELEVVNEYLTNTDSVDSLGDLPLVVISRSKPLQEPWKSAQEELADLSTNSRRVYARNSGHNIQFSEPEVIVEEVNELILHVRQNKRLSEI